MKEIQALWEKFVTLFERDVATKGVRPTDQAMREVVKAVKDRLAEIDKVLSLNHFILPVKLKGSTIAQPEAIAPVDVTAQDEYL